MKRLLSTLMFLAFVMPAFAQDETVRIYIAPQIGTGAFHDPYRSKLNEYINVENGESFDEIDNPARRHSLCFVIAKPATHAAIAADAEIIAVTPNEVTKENVHAILDTPLSSLNQTFKQSVSDALEAKGVSFAWAGGENTIRDVLRYLLRVHFFAQRIEGEGNAPVFNFLKKNLTTEFSELTSAQKNGIKNWMESKGLATGWLRADTTVRQIIHAVVTDLGFGAIKIGGHSF